MCLQSCILVSAILCHGVAPGESRSEGVVWEVWATGTCKCEGQEGQCIQITCTPKIGTNVEFLKSRAQLELELTAQARNGSLVSGSVRFSVKKRFEPQANLRVEEPENIPDAVRLMSKRLRQA